MITLIDIHWLAPGLFPKKGNKNSTPSIKFNMYISMWSDWRCSIFIIHNLTMSFPLNCMLTEPTTAFSTCLTLCVFLCSFKLFVSIQLCAAFENVNPTGKHANSTQKSHFGSHFVSFARSHCFPLFSTFAHFFFYVVNKLYLIIIGYVSAMMGMRGSRS